MVHFPKKIMGQFFMRINTKPSRKVWKITRLVLVFFVKPSLIKFFVTYLCCKANVFQTLRISVGSFNSAKTSSFIHVAGLSLWEINWRQKVTRVLDGGLVVSVMHVFTTDSFVPPHNGAEEADCGWSGCEQIKKGGFGRGWEDVLEKAILFRCASISWFQAVSN